MRNSSILFALLLSLAGCVNPKATNNKPTVTVSIVPQKFFVEKIAGDRFNINIMIPPGGSPATYEPTPQQMMQLSASEAYFRIGHISFEKAWMPKIASVNKQMKIYDTSEGLSLIAEEAFGEVHTDSHGHAHSHDGYNPHIWLSPDLVKKQAENIYKALAELYPEYKDSMALNLQKFAAQCDSVHHVLDKQLKNAGGTSFIVYHPVWSYLARDYQLVQVAIEHNGKEATADKLKRVIDYANEHNIRIVFVQKEFSDAQAKTIAKEIHGDVALMNPLDEDWFNTMREFGEVFTQLHQ